jgi:hypothetical protein
MGVLASTNPQPSTPLGPDQVNVLLLVLLSDPRQYSFMVLL